ncbi:Uncharacterised protein [Klebsiella michiganensis]|uniref:Phospholipase D-like domain-containing protein n=1 Tax=Klebsiella michiganensis TaxID=1134687 RepID=A0A7H4M138_9ENTR|nr:Uncharacterised protein [Klebsiella michiganensis]
MIALDKPKRTSIAVYPYRCVSLLRMKHYIWTGSTACFIPRCFTLKIRTRKIVLGAGSANLTLSGWGRNQEAVDFRTVSSNAQYQQIKQFFMGLDEEPNQDILPADGDILLW